MPIASLIATDSEVVEARFLSHEGAASTGVVMGTGRMLIQQVELIAARRMNCNLRAAGATIC